EFELQGVRLFGTEECRPCYWMDRAFAPGAQEFLRGRGGLRAKILTSGRLRSTLFNIETESDVAVTSPLATERAGRGYLSPGDVIFLRKRGQGCLVFIQVLD